MTRSLVSAMLLLAGCTGIVTAPGGDDGPSASPNVDLARCDEGDVPEADLLRIDRDTYLAALDELFGEDALDAIGPAVSALPEASSAQYSAEVDAPSYEVILAYANIASALAFEVTADRASMGALRACLETLDAVGDPATDPCLVSFVDDFGRRLIRRPVDDALRAELLDAYAVGGADSVPDGVATMLMAMLMHPRFLYFVEVDGEEIAPGVVRLTPHELAARLARILWNGIPDEELLAAADAGMSDAMLEAQLARMWEDPRARGAARRFYAEWLELPSAHTGLERGLLDFAETITFERDGSYRDLLLDRTAFIADDEHAALYALPEGTRGEASLEPTRYAGLLTRPAWLRTGAIERTDAGHVIKRGARLGRFLCDALPPPDPNVFPADNPAEPGDDAVPIRERFAGVTSEPACAHCHDRLDRFGAPFGHYDASGAYIEVESIERADDLPPLEASIDAHSGLPLDGTEVEIDGAIALSEALADSPQAAACFAAHVTRSFVGRELRDGDGCLVTHARDVLVAPDADPGSVRAAIFAILASPQLATRTVPTP